MRTERRLGPPDGMAGVQHRPGQGWHSLRRKFASEYRDVPLKVLCDLGGWKSPETILMCYQHTDLDALRQHQAVRSRFGEAGPMDSKGTVRQDGRKS